MLSFFPQKTNPLPKARHGHSAGGFTITEVLVASLVLLISYIALTQSFVVMNRRAAASRLRTNARVIVERNIAQALAVPFTSTVIPAILATTSSSGLTYDDDGNGDNQVNLMVQDSSGTVQLKAVLTRIVTAVSNPENTDIRRVTFRVNYSYRMKDYIFEMTTVRSRT